MFFYIQWIYTDSITKRKYMKMKNKAKGEKILRNFQMKETKSQLSFTINDFWTYGHTVCLAIQCYDVYNIIMVSRRTIGLEFIWLIFHYCTAHLGLKPSMFLQYFSYEEILSFCEHFMSIILNIVLYFIIFQFVDCSAIDRFVNVKCYTNEDGKHMVSRVTNTFIKGHHIPRADVLCLASRVAGYTL